MAIAIWLLHRTPASPLWEEAGYVCLGGDGAHALHGRPGLDSTPDGCIVVLMNSNRPATRPVPPTVPACITSREQAMARSLITMDLADLQAVLDGLTYTAEEAAEMAAYDAAVVEYNRQVDAWNAPIKAARQRAANERQAAATLAATCMVCFTVKTAAGTCMCD